LGQRCAWLAGLELLLHGLKLPLQLQNLLLLGIQLGRKVRGLSHGRHWSGDGYRCAEQNLVRQAAVSWSGSILQSHYSILANLRVDAWRTEALRFGFTSDPACCC
jgi:hypothetical protein